MLKIFAWNDRKSNKDSQDLWIIVKNYLDLGNEELLYSQNSDLLEDENFDLKIAGARILGRNLRRICSHQSSEMVCSILENDKILQKIGLEIHRFEARLDDNFDHVMKVLESLRQGFKETVN